MGELDAVFLVVIDKILQNPSFKVSVLFFANIRLELTFPNDIVNAV